MKMIHRGLLIVLFAVFVSGCGGSGLHAGSSGDATMGGSGGTSGGGGVGVDAAATSGVGGGGTVSGGSSGSGIGGMAGGSSGSGASAGGNTRVGGSLAGGGAGASGGRTGGTGGVSAGGSTRVGGSLAGGGAGASGGRTAGTGGAVAGGSGGAGGRSSGGSAGASGGRTAGTGVAGGSGGAGGSSGGGSGILGSGYCTGSTPKVTYQGQDATPSVTNYRSGLVFDCCNAVGVNLHTKASLGIDLQVEVIMSGTPADGDYTVDASSFTLRAAMRTDQEALQPMHLANGSLRFAGNPFGTQAWQLGLCLQMDDATSPSFGTRIYVPSVTMSPNWQKRLQFYLLQDASLTAYDAGKLALNSLTLAAMPLLDLGGIAYVEQATGRIGLNPGQKIGTSLRSKLGQVNMYGLPFVVVADDVRIYLGSFMSPASSVSPTGPYVYVDSVGTDMEGITADGFVIQPPWTGSDPRSDPRIVQVLTEAGKLVP